MRNPGESNGKLPLRTCPGCSVPEPYRSPDWALVLPKLAQGLNTNNNNNNAESSDGMIIGDELETSKKKPARAYFKILTKTKRHELLLL
jgi:hypothetical protein